MNAFHTKGFSFIELLVCLVIMSILAMIAIPTVELSVKRQKEQELRTALREVRNALDEYKYASDSNQIPKRIGESGYPPSLDILVKGVDNTKILDKNTIFFLRKVPVDPMSSQNFNLNDNSNRNWGLRSYESSAENPKEGEDIYDIYSKSTEIGLNGIPYNEW